MPGVPLVAVCGIPSVSLFVHTTLAPTWTVIARGLKAIFFMETVPFTIGAGLVAVGADVGVGGAVLVADGADVGVGGAVVGAGITAIWVGGALRGDG
jgi:hypothetical protein